MAVDLGELGEVSEHALKSHNYIDIATGATPILATINIKTIILLWRALFICIFKCLAN